VTAEPTAESTAELAAEKRPQMINGDRHPNLAV
jgi:hypothetical protein